MSKELEALKRIKSHYNDRVCIDILEDFDLIETALKRLEVYETFDLLDEKYDDVDKLTDIKGKLTYVDRVMDTQERLLTSVSSDEIRILSSVLNSQIRNLKKKLKAYEIIIKKMVNLDDLNDAICEDSYHQNNEHNAIDIYNQNRFEYKQLTQEEFDLLKGALL